MPPAQSTRSAPMPVRSCAGCSACCEEQGLPPGYLDPTRLTFLPQPLRDEIAWHQHEEAEAGRTRAERGLPCIWLDSVARRCTQYAYRPERCRDFPVGGSGCAFWRVRRPPPARRGRTRVRRSRSVGGLLEKMTFRRSG